MQRDLINKIAKNFSEMGYELDAVLDALFYKHKKIDIATFKQIVMSQKNAPSEADFELFVKGNVYLQSSKDNIQKSMLYDMFKEAF